jgi:NADPH:quinone reductase-like Zn-dependent oxidoreductase
MVGYKVNKDLNYLVELFKAGKLKPVIGKCFSLEETADAHKILVYSIFNDRFLV